MEQVNFHAYVHGILNKSHNLKYLKLYPKNLNIFL